MPPRVTAATGFDALTHCLEAYVSLGDHPMADAIALGGLELVRGTFGARGVDPERHQRTRRHDEGSDDGRGRVPERARGVPLARAPTLERAATCITALRTRSVFRQSIEFNESAVGPKLDRIRTIFDGKAKTLATAIRQLRERVGLPSALSKEGVMAANIPKLADKAIEDACHRSNPRPCTREDLARLYEASL